MTPSCPPSRRSSTGTTAANTSRGQALKSAWVDSAVNVRQMTARLRREPAVLLEGLTSSSANLNMGQRRYHLDTIRLPWRAPRLTWRAPCPAHRQTRRSTRSASSALSLWGGGGCAHLLESWSLSPADAELAPAALSQRPLARGTQSARPGDNCPECRRPLRVLGMEHECSMCHEVFEAADIQDVISVSSPENPGASVLRGRLCIVGPEASWFQPDLDRTNPGETSEARKKTTYAELLRFNQAYEDRGGHPFPKDVLSDVAENYHIIQQNSVKRSMMKKGIFAALVFHACISRGFARTRAEAAEFAKLPNHGIARGDDFLRSIDEDKGLDINMNESRLYPHIATTFSYLDLDISVYDPLRAAIAALVEIVERRYIGVRSILRSKVVATTYEVLRRKGLETSVEGISTRCKIRKHTIRRFLDELANYHSHFEEEYRRQGLDASRVNC